MKRPRWPWVVAAIAAVLVGSGVAYAIRPGRALDVVVLDKTVPFRNYLEHRSLFWLLRHEKVTRPDGGSYETARDYLGAYPPVRPGDPPERTADLDGARARSAQLVYLADTYGVYDDDLLSGEEMKAALERSPRVYGGLEVEEAEVARAVVESGRTVVAEFNTLGSPTGAAAREILEGVLGVRWSHWIGRYFSHLGDVAEVPQWLRRNYEREWGSPWSFSGPGYVLLCEDAHVEVLRVGSETHRIGLTLERERPVDPLLDSASDHVPYPYWFDLVDADPGTRVLATFHWHLTPDGLDRLAARRLPTVFPAVTRREGAHEGMAYYFAGDFADNPMPDHPVPLAGYATVQRWLQAARLAPSEMAFYWRFYHPMVTRLLEDL